MERSLSWPVLVTQRTAQQDLERPRRAESRRVTSARNGEEASKNPQMRTTRSEEGLDPSQGSLRPLEDDLVDTGWIPQATTGRP